MVQVTHAVFNYVNKKILKQLKDIGPKKITTQKIKQHHDNHYNNTCDSRYQKNKICSYIMCHKNDQTKKNNKYT